MQKKDRTLASIPKSNHEQHDVIVIRRPGTQASDRRSAQDAKSSAA
jgi:hypothetical protein